MENLSSEEGQPGMTHESEPEKTHESKPEKTHESKPAMTHESKPAMTHESKPAMTHESEPEMTHETAAGDDARVRAGVTGTSSHPGLLASHERGRTRAGSRAVGLRRHVAANNVPAEPFLLPGPVFQAHRTTRIGRTRRNLPDRGHESSIRAHYVM